MNIKGQPVQFSDCFIHLTVIIYVNLLNLTANIIDITLTFSELTFYNEMNVEGTAPNIMMKNITDRVRDQYCRGIWD